MVSKFRGIFGAKIHKIVHRTVTLLVSTWYMYTYKSILKTIIDQYSGFLTDVSHFLLSYMSWTYRLQNSRYFLSRYSIPKVLWWFFRRWSSDKINLILSKETFRVWWDLLKNIVYLIQNIPRCSYYSNTKWS